MIGLGSFFWAPTCRQTVLLKFYFVFSHSDILCLLAFGFLRPYDFALISSAKLLTVLPFGEKCLTPRSVCLAAIAQLKGLNSLSCRFMFLE